MTERLPHHYDADAFDRYFAGDMTDDEAATLVEHLAECAACLGRADRISQVVRELDLGAMRLEAPGRRPASPLAASAVGASKQQAEIVQGPESEPRRSRHTPLTLVRSRELAYAAAALGLIAASILFVVNQRGRLELARAAADRSALLGREQDMQRELSRLKSAPPISPTTTGTSPAGSSPRTQSVVASLTLIPDQARSRGSAGTPAQVIPTQVGSLLLFMPLERDAYPAGYSLAVETVDGVRVARASGLKAESFPDGTRWVRAQVSAEALKTGTYVVNLFGTTPDGRAIEESNYQMQIVRR
jgi:hypothetical protein